MGLGRARHEPPGEGAVELDAEHLEPLAAVVGAAAALPALAALERRLGDDERILERRVGARPELDDAPDRLVALRERKVGVGMVALKEMQVGAADARGDSLDHYFAGAGRRIGLRLDLQAPRRRRYDRDSPVLQRGPSTHSKCRINPILLDDEHVEPMLAVVSRDPG